MNHAAFISTNRVLLLAAALVLTVPASGALAQPSLDELLGLEDPAQTDPADESTPEVDAEAGDVLPEDDRPDDTPDPTRAALDRALEAANPGDDVEQAAVKMADAATQLEAGRTGAQTQRLQGEIIRLLDQAIDKARQNQQQQQQSSSSSSSSSSSGEEPRDASSMSQGNQQNAQNNRDTGGSGDDATDLPGARDGDLAERLESSRAAWGALPQRTRDALLQGSSDRFSSLYRRLTEDYYRRLAEDSP